MNDPENQSSAQFSREQENQASHWVARHERGLSADETREFERWLSEDSTNENCFFEHQVAWASFDVMDEWRPTYSSAPNPDLFENRKKKSWMRLLPYMGLAAAIAFGIWIGLLQKVRNDDTDIGISYVSQKNEKYFLEDGSSFYLRPDSEIIVKYSEIGRNIEFVYGEAHFSVAHDPIRPFVVQSDIGRVTAIGTSFSVRQDSDSWEVFVTDGRVKVDESDNGESSTFETKAFSAELIAGQKVIQELSKSEFSPEINSFTENELRERLAWRDQIIDMVSAPLEEILLEFRYFNDRDVIILDDELKRMRMSVTIKPDNLEDFIDLLGLSAGVKATYTRSGSIMLTRSSD